ncbi:MFS family permease [Rhodopseudomonas rhenobacensis]|uniref:MFS family permease n=1 Tax=Rhodopseudomonas rhenobacensis TaxID=87461 RepID=A0A7W7Z7W9_9BRAD|nr:MFS transporter [Rhodopseudomonas rhenobacensis]MBB5049122.1 MFS family permease [Rhodopseudomonas rhenobacensis]
MRRQLPPAAMTAFSFLAAVLVTASSAAATPLYRLYQQSMQLSPLMVTVVFAVYAFSLLAALLTVGGLSDYVGRRPVIFGALLLNAAAMILFAGADNVVQLILARAVQGLCVGTATTALGAAILDTNRTQGPLLNSVTAFVGMMFGALGTAALIAFAPNPLHLVFEVLLGLTALMLGLLWLMPESAGRKPGALASLWPQVTVPRQSRAVLLRIMPAGIATWALGGFHLSLMPTVVATTMGTSSPWIGGGVVATLMLFAAIAVGLFRFVPAERLMAVGTSTLALGVAISLFGIQQHSVAELFAGTAVAGIGFGGSFSATLRALLPTAELHQRAGLLAAFYLQSYLSFSLPAIAAGLGVPLLGLVTVAYVYGGVIIALAVISLIASVWTARAG